MLNGTPKSLGRCRFVMTYMIMMDMIVRSLSSPAILFDITEVFSKVISFEQPQLFDKLKIQAIFVQNPTMHYIYLPLLTS